MNALNRRLDVLQASCVTIHISCKGCSLCVLCITSWLPSHVVRVTKGHLQFHLQPLTYVRVHPQSYSLSPVHHPPPSSCIIELYCWLQRIHSQPMSTLLTESFNIFFADQSELAGTVLLSIYTCLPWNMRSSYCIRFPHACTTSMAITCKCSVLHESVIFSLNGISG